MKLCVRACVSVVGCVLARVGKYRWGVFGVGSETASGRGQW
jgi:hypothetical protein